MKAEATKTLENPLQRVVVEVVESCGVEFVDLVLRGAGGQRILRVDIDRAGPDGVTVDDCQRVSLALGEALDEADSIPYRYTLEVSSPGADRPIRTPDDIRRNTGRRVHVVSNDAEGSPVDHRGVLLGSDGGFLLLSADGNATVRVPLDRMLSARQDLEL